MKHNRAPAFLLLAVLAFSVGCSNKAATTSVPAPPTAGARDATDATAFRVIADAYAFITSVRNSVTSKSLTLTAAQTVVFNDVIASYNAAYAVGVAYHGGANNAAQLNTATSDLSGKLTTASSLITVTP